ncbi:hypothetical protein Ami103574_15100 [Aminipila butyrica]|uniref:Uncharacterized protein n=1 Tax=Aminipila butyrica TaxID=433296 RepID=A0A858BZH0_9FIRM|nr:hypothetical protein [Aminipila butyrica]QIB70538.1 hypothetical protein Ami103574_15100 [Aminipila butyrica]
MKESNACFFDRSFDNGCGREERYQFSLAAGWGKSEALPFEDLLSLGGGQHYEWRGNGRGLPGQQLCAVSYGSLR